MNETRHWRVVSDPDSLGSLVGCIMGDCELSYCLWYGNFTPGSQVKHRRYGTFTVIESDIKATPNMRTQPQMLRNGMYRVRSNGDGRVIVETLDGTEPPPPVDEREYQRKYREVHPDRGRERSRKYYQRNREWLNESRKQKRRELSVVEE